VVGVKARLLDQAQTVLEKLAQRPTIAVEVIEDGELQHIRGRRDASPKAR